MQFGIWGLTSFQGPSLLSYSSLTDEARYSSLSVSKSVSVSAVIRLCLLQTWQSQAGKVLCWAVISQQNYTSCKGASTLECTAFPPFLLRKQEMADMFRGKITKFIKIVGKKKIELDSKNTVNESEWVLLAQRPNFSTMLFVQAVLYEIKCLTCIAFSLQFFRTSDGKNKGQFWNLLIFKCLACLHFP